MNISFYTSRTSLIAQQQALDVYANNVANVNTVGFKSLRPSFAECLYTHQHPNRGDLWQTGHGARVYKTDLMWQEAGITFSDMPLDFALVDMSFFMTLDRYGNTFLTRDGRFGISETSEGVWELVNGFGDFVLDFDGNRIIVPFEIGSNGEPSTEIDYTELYAQIGMFTVPNNWGLDQEANNRFVVTERSGAAVANPAGVKVPMAYEMSAVDLAGEMVRIIETQRSYQLNARAIQTSDELMRIINNLR
ncbi:MAG: flagellar hook-basal body protein [Oscillospiraceae bacterium]|nr:flagellar hook-basal body protein [Oscillospiraceae bacterium]